MPRKLEVVTWRDAYFDQDEPAKVREDYIVRTVGWTAEEEKFLVVRSEKLPKGEDPRWRAVTRIPWGIILKRTIVATVKGVKQDAHSGNRAGSGAGQSALRGSDGPTPGGA